MEVRHEWWNEAMKNKGDCIFTNDVFVKYTTTIQVQGELIICLNSEKLEYSS